jgi:hypothetical protein
LHCDLTPNWVTKPFKLKLMKSQRSHSASGLAAALLLVPTVCGVVLHKHQRTAAASDVLVNLPRGFKPEGIASDGSNGFFSASLNGWILHHDLERGLSSKVVGSEIRSYSLQLTGLKYCPRQKAIFAAGSFHGMGYVLYLEQKEGTFHVIRRVDLDFGPRTYLNDVFMSNDTVFFTDSWQPKLYALSRYGEPSSAEIRPYDLGPAMKGPMGLLFSSNGLVAVEEAPSHTTLVVAHWAKGALYKVTIQRNMKPSQTAPAVQQIAISDLSRHLAGDGIVLGPSRLLYVADNINNRVVQMQLSADFTSAKALCSITSSNLHGVSTMSYINGRLWATNSHFASCFLLAPCRNNSFEVLGLVVRDYCKES